MARNGERDVGDRLPSDRHSRDLAQFLSEAYSKTKDPVIAFAIVAMAILSTIIAKLHAQVQLYALLIFFAIFLVAVVPTIAKRRKRDRASIDQQRAQVTVSRPGITRQESALPCDARVTARPPHRKSLTNASQILMYVSFAGIMSALASMYWTNVGESTHEVPHEIRVEVTKLKFGTDEGVALPSPTFGAGLAVDASFVNAAGESTDWNRMDSVFRAVNNEPGAQQMDVGVRPLIIKVPDSHGDREQVREILVRIFILRAGPNDTDYPVSGKPIGLSAENDWGKRIPEPEGEGHKIPLTPLPNGLMTAHLKYCFR